MNPQKHLLSFQAVSLFSIGKPFVYLSVDSSTRAAICVKPVRSCTPHPPRKTQHRANRRQKRCLFALCLKCGVNKKGSKVSTIFCFKTSDPVFSDYHAFSFFARGRASSSRTRRSICFSMAVRRSSGRLMDGCRVKRKPIRRRSWLRCFVPMTSRQIAS